jgi:tetratricopeptide (TPR) repeat protein
VEIVHRLAYFAYQQVASARMLEQLVREGISPQTIRSGLERLRTWLPDVDRPLAQLTSLECDGTMLVRLESGQLAEPNGQLRFDFGASSMDACAAVKAECQRTADEAFEEALRYEDAGELGLAAACYREAIAIEPDNPIVHFNLGNVVYQLGDVKSATTHFRQATTFDPCYVEAWNNLGSVLCDIKQLEEGISAFRRAIQLVPHYADAHYNLADALATLGRTNEAREHWERYLKLDPTSDWADKVRQKLCDR